jgi:colanic acid biosynthesis glycosyl transferase WcaI
MRVLIIHMRYSPDATGTGPLVTELAEDLASQGDDVRVITSAPHYGRTAVAKGYRSGWVQKRRERDVEVWRTWSFAPRPGSVLGRGLDYGVYLLLSTIAGIVGGKPDVILCVAPPITVALTGWLVSRVKRTPLVLNAQDIWPDGLVQMGRLRNRWGIRAFRWLERFSYKAAHALVVVSEGMRDNLVGKQVPSAKVSVIPNWVDPETVGPLPKEHSMAPDLGIEDRFVVLFAGNLGYAACLETIIGAASRLKENSRILFLLVGEGSAKADAERIAGEAGLSNVRFVTTQPKSHIGRVYATGDLCLVTLRDGMGRLSMPSKTYTIMAAGRPILAAVPEGSEVREVVDQARCGRSIPPENPDAMAGAVLDLEGDREQLKQWGRNAAAFVGSHYTRQTCTGAYARLLHATSGRTDIFHRRGDR